MDDWASVWLAWSFDCAEVTATQNRQTVVSDCVLVNSALECWSIARFLLVLRQSNLIKIYKEKPLMFKEHQRFLEPNQF
jgi:hypothetical protein